MVDLAGYLRVLEERADLGCETQRSLSERVEQRLLPDAVAGEQECSPGGVPDGECEHSVQAVHAPGSKVLVEMGDHLGVPLGRERMALRGELLPQLAIVVDLAVEHDGDGAVFVVDRLISRLKVDHSETLDTEPDGTVQMRST